MNKNMNDLERKILEKNFMLNSLNTANRLDKEKIGTIKAELDNLLYLYYKSMKCSCNNTFVLWSEGV
ncbi:MAG: hypothetical protein N2645_23595 [Clostridia bacterium]|nr:hypothetical protein [Clostridia bacterium]